MFRRKSLLGSPQPSMSPSLSYAEKIRRPWRILIEVGAHGALPTFQAQTADTTPATTPASRDAAWELLKDARKRLSNAMGEGNAEDISSINNWIGGGVAVYAVLTDGNAEALLEKLREATPIESGTPGQIPGVRANFYQVERERPKPPPGAPRPLNPEDLTQEERDELGIVLPDEVPTLPSSEDSTLDTSD